MKLYSTDDLRNQGMPAGTSLVGLHSPCGIWLVLQDNHDISFVQDPEFTGPAMFDPETNHFSQFIHAIPGLEKMNVLLSPRNSMLPGAAK